MNLSPQEDTDVTKIHVNVFIPLERLIKFQNERLFEYHWPLTLKYVLRSIAEYRDHLSFLQLCHRQHENHL